MRRYQEIGSEADRLFYGGSHYLISTAGRLAVGLKVEGGHNLPQQGRGLIVCNHLHGSDVLFVPASIPDRHVTVVARRKYMEKPFIGAIFRRWGAVVIDRGLENPGREALRQSLETMKAPLEDDRLELAFASPNTRTPGKKPGATNGGVARAAYAASADVYAAVIKGSDRLRDRQVTVSFSPSLGHPESDKSKERKEFLHHIWEVQTRMFDQIPHHQDYYTRPDDN